ncbi:MAG: DNA-directed RNA polymerase subunit delta [Culicoidibacterales bacterium]
MLDKFTQQQIMEMSFVQLAYEILTEMNAPLQFNELVVRVQSAQNIASAEEMNLGQYYTDLTTDGRFLALSDGSWDLRTRHRFEEINNDDFMLDEEEELDIDEDDAEELGLIDRPANEETFTTEYAEELNRYREKVKEEF